jgi:predicted nicotinamide N-methyase
MRKIAGYDAVEERFVAGAVDVVCYRVADLERVVDRQALLRDDEIPEPPYWAHRWIGAAAVARYLAEPTIDLAGRAVLDLGCGVGLTGLVAAARGADVWFADRAPAALEFVAASLERNALPGHPVALDFVRDRPARRFDLVIGAEIVYEPAAYAPLAEFLDAAVAPGGELLLTDAFRSDATTFFATLERRGFRGRRMPRREWEEGRPQGLFLCAFSRSEAGGA